mmetsp:Transcript_41162/g.65728  ORF Transcript_41162/g.65728 Transcript_41162/m.65728 type:complete len:187 (-) Transcript_41162:53-613(-)
MAVQRRSARNVAWALLGVGMAVTLSGCFEAAGKCVAPVQGTLLYGCESHVSLAEEICCHNTDFAEPSGFFGTIGSRAGGLFAQLDQNGITTFYDSVCGVSLFRAPVGRSFEAWQSESHYHGWPSFRTEEIVKENVVFKFGGEMRSICGTHLGHNIPDFSGDRYCIDLVCIAGNKNETRQQTAAIHQ